MRYFFAILIELCFATNKQHNRKCFSLELPLPNEIAQLDLNREFKVGEDLTPRYFRFLKVNYLKKKITKKNKSHKSQQNNKLQKNKSQKKNLCFLTFKKSKPSPEVLPPLSKKL